MMRRLISFVLTVIFVFQAALPAFAVITSLAELEEKKAVFKTVSVLPSARTFPSNADKTAAGTLFYAVHDGDIKILLGQRDDGDGWCNFGGKSDAKDETLTVTASRESSEESFGIFAIHPRILSKCFSHDLYSPSAELEPEVTEGFLSEKKNSKTLLYRMFISSVEYVAASVFKDKLESATESHHKEYRDFTWIPLKDFIEVLQGKNTLTSVLKKIQKGILSDSDSPLKIPEDSLETLPLEILSIEEKLFDPFLEILKTGPVLRKLEDLLQKGISNAPSSFEEESHTISLMGGARPQMTHIKWQTVSEETPQHVNFLTPQTRIRETFFGENPSAENLFSTHRQESPDQEITDMETILGSNGTPYFYSKRNLFPEQILYSQTLVSDPKTEKNNFIEAFTAKVLMNLEFKKTMKEAAKKKVEAIPSSVSSPPDKKPYTATEAHLRLWLGEAYVAGENKTNLKALIEKVGMKGELRREVELTDEAFDRLSLILETEQKMIFHERLQEMPFGYDTFYHGCRQEMINLYQALSTLENLFFLKEGGEFSALRGMFSHMNKYPEITHALETYHQDHRTFYTFLYHQHKTENKDPALIERSEEYQTWDEAQKEKIHKIWKETLPLDDSKIDNGYLMLWLNAVLSAGKVTTNVTSSTIEYFLNSHSVKKPDDKKLFQESMALRGIEASYQWFQSLFEQYINPLSPEGKSNGGLLQIFVNTTWRDLYTITIKHGGGIPYGHPIHVKEEDKKPYVGRMLQKLQEEAKKRDLPPEEQIAHDVMEHMIRTREESPVSVEEKPFMKSLISEVCLFLHPLLTQSAFINHTPEQDPAHTDALRAYEARYENPDFPPLHTKGYFRYPLSEANKKIFDLKMSHVASALMADWLNQGTKPLEGSFYSSPVLFDFYHRIYQDFTNEAPPQETYQNSLPHLIGLEDVTTLKSFLNLYKDTLITSKIDLNHCLLKLCHEDKWGIFLLLYDTLKDAKDLSPLFTPQNQKKIARQISESKSFSDEASLFFKKHLDVTSFDLPFQESLLTNILNNLPLYVGSYPPAEDSLSLKFFIELGVRFPNVSSLNDLSTHDRYQRFQVLFNDYMPVEEKDARGYTPLEQLLDYIEPFQEDGPIPDVSNALILLLQRGANWKQDTRIPGTPILFELFKYVNVWNLTNKSPDLWGILNDLKTYQNAEGLTCLQYYQKEYLRGDTHTSSSYYLHDLLFPKGASPRSLFYPKFFEFFLHQSSPPHKTPWASETARQWQREFEKALEEQNDEEIFKLIEMCPEVELLKINRRILSFYDNYVALKNEYTSKMWEAYTLFKNEKESRFLEWSASFKKAVEDSSEILFNLIENLESYIFQEEAEKLPLTEFKRKFPDLYGLYTQKQSSLLESLNYTAPHPLLPEHDRFSEALKTHTKEAMQEAFHLLREKVTILLSDPRTAVEKFGFSAFDFPSSLDEACFQNPSTIKIDACLKAFETNKSALDQQKKDWGEALQQATSKEDLTELETLIATAPFELAPHAATSVGRYDIYPPIKALLKNKFAPLIPILLKKINDPFWWHQAIIKQPPDYGYEDEIILAFFQNYSDPLTFIKSCQNSPLIGISSKIINQIASFLYKKFPQILRDPEFFIGERAFLQILNANIEEDYDEFLKNLHPDVFKKTRSRENIPYLWHIGTAKNSHVMLSDLIRQNPDWITLKEISGMTLKETIDHLKTYSENQAPLVKLLEKFQKVLMGT